MSRKRGIESALDKCLFHLQEGDSIEECLARYPKLVQELEPLLRVAVQAQQLRGRVSAPKEALAAGRASFLNQAAILRDERERSRTGTLSRLRDGLRVAWAGLARRRGLTTIAASVLLLFGLLGGGTIASANSLPGDPLYPLKRASEQVQLALAFGSETKAELRDSFDKRRIEEVHSILEVRRETRVRFKGTVLRIADDQWAVSGVDLVMETDTTVEGNPLIGREVHVEAVTRSDGRVIARYVRVITPVTPPATATPVPTATATVTAEPTNTEQTAPALAPVTPTSEPTATQSSSKRKPKRTATPKPTSTPQEPTPSLEPTEVETATPTPTLMEPTPEPPRDVKVKFEGLIREITSASWLIGDHSVQTDASTQVLEEKGTAEVGAWARVKAIRRQDGSLLALQIIIERASETHGEPVEFRGVIDHIGDTEWTVEGQSIRIIDSTVIEGTPEIGHVAEVKALRLSDGSLTAKHISVKPPELQEVEFEGVIESIGDSIWVVDGHSVHIDGETAIQGNAWVGLSVEIRAVVLPDGTILARHIRVKSPTIEPSATPIPTTTPPPTPTPEPPTATPTQENPTEPTATPSPGQDQQAGPTVEAAN